MELVYLWVEEYKNIKNQGFNFSPRFTCKYEDGELTIHKKEHVSIFPKNINITAIVGENGSGKSKALECIAEIFRIEYNKNRNLVAGYEHTFSFHLVFTIGTKQYEIKSINNRDSNTFAENEKIENLLDYFTYFYNQLNIEKQLAFDNTSIAKMIVHDYSKNKNFKLSSFMYLPNQIKIRLCDFEKKFEKLISDDKLYPPYRNEPDSVYLKNTSNSINNQIESFNSINDKYHQFLIIKLLEKSLSTPDYYLLKETILKQLNEEDLINEEKFNEYFIFLNEPMLQRQKRINKLTPEEKSIYIDKYSDFFEFDFSDDRGIRYSDLSHGEQTLFGQLLNIYYYSQKSENNNFVFLFDEPEIALHPKWQKNYLNEVINLLQKIPKKYHFIFASHSPFLLSDLPQENIIFLKKDEVTGNCRNVTGKTNIETFGANIHTLLSHGFFMKDGLMGEFAKEKINEVISTLKKETLSKDEINRCKNIISIIGEPILKSTLEKMLDEKLKSNESELERLEREQKEIQEKIDRLKANNETN